MKKLISVFLALVLIASCLQLTAAAKDMSIEQKFRLMLEDMELDPSSLHSTDRYFYEELAQYPAQDPDWVLLRAGLTSLEPQGVLDIHWGTLGNKFVSSGYDSLPFSFGFGVYDVKKNAFCDVVDAWDMDFANLHSVWNSLESRDEISLDAVMLRIGDADGDCKVSILDATRIQRILAEMDADRIDLSLSKQNCARGLAIGSICDYDRDGRLTILDATKIQRSIAGLPNNLESKLTLDKRTKYLSGGEGVENTAQLITNTPELDAFYLSYGENANASDPDYVSRKDIAGYDDAYFEKKMLIGCYAFLNSSSGQLRYQGASLGNDGTLDVRFMYDIGSSATADVNNRFVLIEASKAFTDDIYDVRIDVTAEKKTASIIAEIPSESQITATVPDDLNSGGYREVVGEKLMISGPGEYDYGFSYLLDDIGTGYVMLIRSRKDFERYLPEFDKEGTLDDEFFDENAVLAVLEYGGAAETYAVLSDIAVYRATTLWCSSRIGHHYIFDPEEPLESPTDPIIWTLLKIKQSDVQSVDAISFWKGSIPGDDNDYEYTVNDNGDVEITNYIGNRTAVSVPFSIRGRKVIAIGDNAFHSVWASLKSVTIPDTVTALGDRVFYQCVRLESVTLPDSITSMGKEVFYQCNSLTHVDLPKKLDGVPEGVFYQCSKLTSFTWPDDPTYIGNSAFRSTALKSVAIPDTVITIGSYAFSGTSIRSIDIPDSVTSIGSEAFYSCRNLEDISMSKNVTSIGSYAFYACIKLESITIPDGVTRINYATFAYCSALETVRMSGRITYIGEQAFDHCSSLLKINIPQGVTAIDNSAFMNCTSLKTLSIPRTCRTFGANAAKNCRSLESVYFANESLSGFELLPIENYTIGSSAFEGCTALTVVSMPDTVKTIGSRAFYGSTALDSIDLPGSVTEIRGDTFNGCESLTTVRQNKSGDLTVKTVGDYAFRSCKALNDIRFTDSLTDIGDAAFRGCSSLNSLDLKENLKTIGTDAFLECTALKKLTVPKSVKTISTGALGYTVDDTNHYVKLTDFTIRGYLDSKAHTYATQRGITFEAID